jgi:S-adenosylmethionine-diacylglycerol 3-amino-3-carboxypropyl transferase
MILDDMQNNKIQFAVVREDPQLELDLMALFGLKSAVIIGSGGCTAISLKTKDPDIRLSIIEPNPAQIKLIKEKIEILQQRSLFDAQEIIGTGQNSLIETGNFESLFKMLRTFIYEFVLSIEDFKQLLESGDATQWQEHFQNRYWRTAFELFFSESLLVSMFGKAAIQYAPKNSYPGYFRKLIEKGIMRSDARHNYFLHHIFFGQYCSEKESLPLYLQKETLNTEMSFHSCFAHEFMDYENFGLVGLSNILDWSSQNEVERIGQLISNSMRKGSVLLFRQLNNSTDFTVQFEGFEWQDELEEDLLKKDRSLFYSKICVGIKL